ncbi:hypothetical protein NMS_2565 [Nonlabens marinus S1-08]|uniref:Uncharacterized protein n=1 Tax=Nonlabens marinus S1-08 TaxID=1454201 RepID=W8VRZ9_9FLAO|nr:hypothetical protein NMS_2565 [Nonlabens marinus S1-08]
MKIKCCRFEFVLFFALDTFSGLKKEIAYQMSEDEFNEYG